MSSSYEPLAEPQRPVEPELRMVLLGKTGAGKSTSGNTILRRQDAFKSTPSPNAVTSECQKETGEFEGQHLTVVDTPGLFDNVSTEEEMMAEISRSICFAAPGPHVFLLVIRVGRFTEEERETVRILQRLFGVNLAHYTMALFTCGDDLTQGFTIEQFIRENQDLGYLIRQCHGGYHVLNNKDQDPTQVRELLEKIDEMVQRNGGSCYTNDMLEGAERAAREEEEDFRIVVVGKTGVGKSTSGNTILGGKAFKTSSSSLSPPSVTSECQKEIAQFDFQTLAVVDTPGLFHTELTAGKVKVEINRCICFAAPGPHVFLVVIQPNSFSDKEQETVKILQMVFGENAARYTMILFTHTDDLMVSMEEFILKTPALCDLVHQCAGRYHVFKNRVRDPSQVKELLEKISTMVQSNNGSYFTNDMFEKAEKAIMKEMERLQTEKKAMTNKEARYRAERSNRFIHGILATIAAAVGLGVGAAAGAAAGIGTAVATEVAVGAIVGAVAGPVGAAVGAGVGLAVGAGVGAGVHLTTAARVKRQACATQ